MKSDKKKSVFETLSAINVNDHTKTYGNGLTYLSWSWAWETAMKHYPEMTSKIYKNPEGLNYHHDGKTAWVETGITIEGIEHIENLPVMDNRNNSIPIAKLTSFDVNNSIQRGNTKALARHGLGMYVYQGEALPTVEVEANNAAAIEKAEKEAISKTLVNQYIKRVEKDVLDDDLARLYHNVTQAFSEILDKENGEIIKNRVFKGLCEEAQQVVLDVMTSGEAA